MGIKNLTEAEEKEFYRLVEKMNGKLDYDVWSVCKPQGGVQFASKQLVFDAIEAVGKERILKYIFGGRK